MPTTVVMPQLGESVVEGTVVRWLAKPGQSVERDQPLVEVATDKANTEIPSPNAGVLAEQLAKEGDVVPVGGPLCRLDEAGAGAGAGAGGGNAEAPVRASPVSRNVAEEHGLDVSQVPGSGSGGRVTKQDVLSYLEQRPQQGGTPPAPSPGAAGAEAPGAAVTGASAPPPQGAALGYGTPPSPQGYPGQQVWSQPPPHYSQPPPQYSQPPPPGARPPQPGAGPVQLLLRAYKPPRYTPKDGDETLPFDQRRRLIAEHMVYSKVTSPHVPCTAEVDMSGLARLRDTWKKDKQTGGKAPSYLVGICRATVLALREFKRMNAVVHDDALIIRKDINLGVAVETEKGLLVPVIRQADEKSILGMSRALDDLAGRARSGKVTADELSGGSFTVSNPGLKGNLFGAAIINQPQVGILRMGEIVKRPVVRELDGQDAIVIRPMMYLTLSYDHRVIDGVTGNSFLHKVCELLEAAQFTL